MRKGHLILPLLILSLTLSGCASFSGYPDSPTNLNAALNKVIEASGGDVITVYNAMPETNDTEQETKMKQRNALVLAWKAEIDRNYDSYLQQLRKESVSLNLAVEWARISLDSAATVIGGQAVKSALAVTSAGLGGAKASFDKNVYYEKTMPVLISKMDALRKEKLVPIETGLNKPVADYGMTIALLELREYFKAGTIQGAILGVAQTSGMEAEAADVDLTFIRNKTFLEKERQRRVDVLLDKIDLLEPREATDLAKNPPVKEPRIEYLVKLRDPENKRLTNANVAKQILRMMVAMGERSDADLEAWEAALTGFVRPKAFVDKERQERVSKILDKIKNLPDPEAIKLAKNPPVQDPKVERLVQRRDPQKKRETSGQAARDILEMIAVMDDRSEKDLEAWEKALGLPE